MLKCLLASTSAPSWYQRTWGVGLPCTLHWSWIRLPVCTVSWFLVRVALGTLAVQTTETQECSFSNVTPRQLGMMVTIMLWHSHLKTKISIDVQCMTSCRLCPIRERCGSSLANQHQEEIVIAACGQPLYKHFQTCHHSTCTQPYYFTQDKMLYLNIQSVQI